MPFETVLVEVDRRVGAISLNRPTSGNLVSEQMAWELKEACAQLGQNDDVRVVVLTGVGEAFCRGTEPSALKDSTLPRLKVAETVAVLEKPVIAAINGDALDQGLELALACDIRIVSREAKLGLTQVGRDLMPWDGGTQRLPRLVGRGRAMEMVLTCRVLSGSEALEAGLVNEVVDAQKVLRRTQEVASAIAGHGPVAARYLKEAVLKGLDLTLEQGLRLEADLNLILRSTADRAEGISSFLERRRPKYTGR